MARQLFYKDNEFAVLKSDETRYDESYKIFLCKCILHKL